MAKRLREFPEGPEDRRQTYPWDEWTDGGVWEIRRGEDYGVPTENMRVTLHLKADALARKVKTKKVKDETNEGLVFQFLASEEEEKVEAERKANPKKLRAALTQLYEDALEIYERAREEVTIPRRDGRRQRYAPIRFRQQIERGNEEDLLVPAVARIVRRRTSGFGHLAEAERPDLMLEALVIDKGKPYHRLFSAATVDVARERMDGYGRGRTEG